MKRALVVAALVGASPIALSTAAEAQLATGQLFNILTPAAGNVQFFGQGTANFNQSLGTTNNFNVGSQTNFGVNASASSTEDYTANGSAALDLAGTSRIQQTIGTAASAFNTATVTEAAATAANSIATETANASSWGAEWSATATYQVDGSETPRTVSQAEWNAGWEAQYNNAYNTAYSNVVSNSSVTSTTQDGGASQTGTISAAFTTTEVGYGGQAMSATLASAAAQAKYGSSWQAGYDYGSGEFTTQADWQAAYDAEYNAAYTQAQSAAAGTSSRLSVSDVKVAGIGVIADINSQDSSTFTATADKAAAHQNGNGNANASAGGNLSTSSYATQANSTTASAFMQAFGTP